MPIPSSFSFNTSINLGLVVMIIWLSENPLMISLKICSAKSVIPSIIHNSSNPSRNKTDFPAFSANTSYVSNPSSPKMPLTGASINFLLIVRFLKRTQNIAHPSNMPFSDSCMAFSLPKARCEIKLLFPTPASPSITITRFFLSAGNSARSFSISGRLSHNLMELRGAIS